MTSGQSLIWSDHEKVLVGQGEVEVIDPGAGAGRYERAQDAVRASGRELGFASFTFDPDAPGSVVLIPGTVVATDWATALGDDTAGAGPAGRVTSDGIEEWRRGFAVASEQLLAGEIEKVVLARRLKAIFDSPLDDRRVLRGLEPLKSHSFVFAIGGLVGASPELLVSLRDTRITAHPLAGTATDDLGLKGRLIATEHRLAAAAVAAAVSAHMAKPPSIDETTVDAGAIKQRGTLIAGPAREGTTITDLVAALHPTPAVGGVPPEGALAMIRSLEPWGRGRYGGPIGWMGPDGEGEFALALRCGQLDGSSVTLYAGGGLVAGCEQESELEETRLKLAPMLTALGLEGGRHL